MTKGTTPLFRVQDGNAGWRYAAQVEQGKAERRGGKRGLQIDGDHDTQPDRIDPIAVIRCDPAPRLGGSQKRSHQHIEEIEHDQHQPWNQGPGKETTKGDGFG